MSTPGSTNSKPRSPGIYKPKSPGLFNSSKPQSPPLLDNDQMSNPYFNTTNIGTTLRATDLPTNLAPACEMETIDVEIEVDRNECEIESGGVKTSEDATGGMKTSSPSMSGGDKSDETYAKTGGILLLKRGTEVRQGLILDALMSCYSKKKMDTASISTKLNELGLKSMVIKGSVDFSFHHGRDEMKWSKWNCNKYGIYTVVTMQYIPPVDAGQKAQCIHQGNMNGDDRDMVKTVLSECRTNHAMKTSDIAGIIKGKGIACLVLRGIDEYHYYKKEDMRMSWSEWVVADYGRYNIILIK